MTLYKGNQLTEVAYLYGVVFLVKKKNIGCFCNTEWLWI